MATRAAAPGHDHTHTLTHGLPGEATRAWVIRVIAGPERGRSLPVADATVVIGSGATAELVLTDPGVSRRHLEVARVPGGLRVVDLQSKNGTLLLGARVSVAVVGLGAELQVGGTVLRVDDADELPDAIERESFAGVSTRSVTMMRALGVMDRLARTDVPLLFEGEHGTGKATLARAVHDASARARRPFVAVDLGVAAATVESALFGAGPVPGAFEQANAGTLLLRNVCDASLELQRALVRALEDGAVARAGDPRSRPVNVRVIGTTARTLDAEVRGGRVRPELRDLLAIGRVAVPPLRERTADLPALTHTLLRELGHPLALDEPTLARLAGHSWPGNLRELRATLARAVTTSKDGAVRVALDVPEQAATLRDQREEFERASLVELLEKNAGNVSAAARAGNIDRRHLHRLLKKHGLRGG